MGNCSNGLVMSQPRDRATIHNLEDASFGPGCGVGRLAENAPHVAGAPRGPPAVFKPGPFFASPAATPPRGDTISAGKRRLRGSALLRYPPPPLPPPPTHPSPPPPP